MRIFNKQLLLHSVVWLIWVCFSILSDVVTAGKLDTDNAIYTFLLITVVSVPVTYLTYFLAFRWFDKHQNYLLLILAIILISVFFVAAEYFFQAWVLPSLNIYPEQKGMAISKNYIVYALNRYYLFFMPFALLYWYSSRLTKSELKRQSLLVEKVKTENEKLQSDYNFLKMQIDPHFIFNCLQSVDNYILKNDTAKASHYLNRFSTLMRRTLEYGPETETKLSEEIANLDLYLQLEQMRTSEAFQFRIDVSAVADPGFIKIPSMIIQPYVENAVQHGINKGGKGDTITLTFTEAEDILTCVVEDNGPGILHTQAVKSNRLSGHKSMGTDITQQRIQTYNSLGKGRISVHTEDRDAAGDGQTGTRVTLQFYFI